MVLNYRRDLVGTCSLKFCLVKRKEKKNEIHGERKEVRKGSC